MEQNFFKIDSKVSEAAKKALEAIEPQFKITDEITEYNQQKVLSAFINNHVS